MKQISKFIVKKVLSNQSDKIEILAEIDSVQTWFVVKLDTASENLLTNLPKDLEFLLRANEVSLSKNLMSFLQKIVEKQSSKLPFILYSRKNRTKSATLSSNRLKAA
jgi:hypothetical protein